MAGKYSTPLGVRDAVVHAVAIQNDGKIIAAGSYVADDFGNLNQTGVLVRYNSNGTIDTTFGSDGVARGFLTVINAVVIQTDGKIVVAGDNAIAGNAVVQRFNSNGTNDSSFGSDIGAVISSGFGQKDYLNSVALQTNGKIVVSGASGAGATSFAFARLNSNGALDTSFDTDGLVQVPLTGAINAVTVQADGKIVAVGDPFGGFAVVRLKSNGTLDESFDGDGIVRGTGNGKDLLIQPNGKIIVAGGIGDISGSDFSVASYNANGSLNTLFGTGGVAQIDFGSTNESASAVTLDYDGNLVAAGHSTDLLAVARLLSDTPPPPPPPPPPIANTLVNISTRMEVLTGDQVLIGGLSSPATLPKKSSCAPLALRLPGSDSIRWPTRCLSCTPPTDLSSRCNDNWKMTAKHIEATGLQPTKTWRQRLSPRLIPATTPRW